MATGTNGLATKSECNALGGYDKFTSNLSEVVTYADIVQASGCPVSPKVVYSDTTKLVKYSDIEPRYTHIYNDVLKFNVITYNNLKNGNINNTSYTLDLSSYSVKIELKGIMNFPKYIGTSQSTSEQIISAANGLLSTNSSYQKLTYSSSIKSGVYFSQVSTSSSIPTYSTLGSWNGSGKYILQAKITVSGCPTKVTGVTCKWTDFNSSSVTMTKSNNTYTYSFSKSASSDTAAIELVQKAKTLSFSDLQIYLT